MLDSSVRLKNGLRHCLRWLSFLTISSSNNLYVIFHIFFVLSIAQETGQASGIAKVSFSSTMLERKQLNAEEEFELKWCAASLYSGMLRPLALHIRLMIFTTAGAADTVSFINIHWRRLTMALDCFYRLFTLSGPCSTPQRS